ncbi:MAG: hypothetical protein V1857_01470 [archaeon]
MHTVTIKVDDELRRRMRTLKINWSDYVRKAIQRRVELEEKRDAAEKLLESLKEHKQVAPRGFINKTIREMRKAR